MSYEVLARKWRPRSFEELVGQEHVRRALVNALDQERLHHAYLFTGTRGVGKTTIARILSKSLNCETHGVTSTPCGECSACREIDEGRFVDLIEVDAASRTRVDETRELLENVPYAPTRGRYKVYLIDEVHMFSTHSFNALLKTLEEPPPHVKFLLATTDPQKVPVTILSRCLQFNLKLMPAPAIVSHLERIVAAEGIGAEPTALNQIARAAAGSMRDALSLLDQAVAYGQGSVTTESVEQMLGTLARDRLFAVLEAVHAGDASGLMAEVSGLAEAAADLEPVLAELLAALHELAVVQAVPDAVDDTRTDGERLRDLAGRIPRADIQLYYQIATLGRRDLAWAPDPRAGLEMTLLRMLAFRPADAPDPAPAPAPAADGAARASKAAAPEVKPSAATEPRADLASVAQSADADPQAPNEKSVPNGHVPEPPPVPESPPVPEAEAVSPATPEPAPIDSEQAESTGDWNAMVAALDIGGLASELAVNTALIEMDERRVRLALAPEHGHLGEDKYRARLEEGLCEYLGRRVKVELESEKVDGVETPAEREQRLERLRQEEAVRRIETDPVVQAMQERFGATLRTDSVRPRDGAAGDGEDGNHEQQSANGERQ